MRFHLHQYHHPDFSLPQFTDAPNVTIAVADMDGVAPEYYHSTSMYPEYFKIDGKWVLAEESRMDSCVLVRDDGHLDVVEARNIKAGDKVILGRTEKGEEGICVNATGFVQEDAESLDEQFVFRQGRSRETSYAKDYDRLMELLRVGIQQQDDQESCDKVHK